MGQIELINNEWLDVDEVESFPIVRKRGDLNNLSSRSGDFSKTITLPGTKNNHKVLGQLFDVNTTDGTFDLNKKVPCFVEKNGVQIWENCFFQLKKVIKQKKSHTNEPDSYKYEALIFNELRDLFKDLDNKNVNELLIADETTNHILNYENIVAGFDNTSDDKYCYHATYLPKIDEEGNDTNQNIYRAKNFKPAIFSKTIFDAIFTSQGREYIWEDIDSEDIQFSKLIHPFVGDVELSEQDRIEQGADIGTPDVQEVEGSPIIESLSEIEYEKSNTFGIQQFGALNVVQEPEMGVFPTPEPSQYVRIVDNINLDLRNQYNETTGIFTPVIQTNYEVLVSFDYEVNFVADANCELVSNNANDKVIYSFNPFVNLTPSARYLVQSNLGAQIVFKNADQLNSGNNVFNGSAFGSITISSNVPSIKTIGFALEPKTLFEQGTFNASWIDTSTSSLVGVQPKLTITSINIKFKSFDEYGEGFLININRFLPNMKQSDYLRSIFTMFNLIPEEDVNDPNKVVIKTRDTYYRSGKQWDFSQKLDRSRDLNIRFLPEVNSKAIELTYDTDKDPYHEAYNTAVNKVFGRMRYIFDSEFTKGVDVKKIAFASTPIASLDAWGGYAPALTSKSEKERILYFQEKRSVSNLSFEKANGDIEPINEIPFAHHWDDPNNPSYDINFGVCDYYFYPNYTHTANNLFNLHYRRTFNQINKGKMAKAWFMLDELIISQIELNDAIYFNNSWWNINKFEYDASNRSNLVKVELISVSDDFTVQAERGNESGRPVYGDFVDDFVQPNFGDPQITLPTANIDNDFIDNNNTQGGNNTGVIITGIRNILNRFVGLVNVIGNNNLINASNVLVVGNNLDVNESGIHTNKLFINGEDITKKLAKDKTTLIETANDTLTVNANEFDTLIWSADFTNDRELNIDNFTPNKRLDVIIINNNTQSRNFSVKARNGVSGGYGTVQFVFDGDKPLTNVNINSGDTNGARWLVISSFDTNNDSSSDVFIGKFN